MRLCRKVIDLIWLNLPNQCMCIARIRQIAIVEEKPPVILNLRQEMVDPLRAGGAVPTDDTVHLIALFEQQFG